MSEEYNVGMLDTIVKNTMNTISTSKNNLFEIATTSKDVHKKVQDEYEEVTLEVNKTIQFVDTLEEEYKKARLHLMDVSRDFKKYTQKDNEVAYRHASELQAQLTAEREKERNLRARREELSRSIARVGEVFKKAEELVSKVDLALTFLSGNLNELSHKMEGIQQRQMMAAQIIMAQEEERRRVAREIHDGPAQSMANVVLRAEICEKLFHANRKEVVDELANLKIFVKDCLKEVRRIIFNLRPMTLDDLGLVPTLRRYLEEMKEREGFVAKLDFSGEERRLNITYEVALFRLIQEALNNAKKHSQAKQILVKVQFNINEIKVMISDDGTGFDLPKVMAEKTGKVSFGLLSMKERIELINGKLQIETAPGSGTKIIVNLPMEKMLSA